MTAIKRAIGAVFLALATVSSATAFARPHAQAQVDQQERVAPRHILFVGNSFTFGALSPVHRYRPGIVHDLNGDGVGGVPALFATFVEQAGLNWVVSLETSPGKGLDWHLANRRSEIDRVWDAVVLQGYSTLDASDPGNPKRHAAAADAIARMVKKRNEKADVELTATWTRADQTYQPQGHWYGKPVNAMADDLQSASVEIDRKSKAINGVVPVGEAWNRAFAEGIADPNPYDGIEFGKLDLWSYDQYHADTPGYYLEALTVFGKVTGRDPRSLGRGERAASDLGLSPDEAEALQAVAAKTLIDHGVTLHTPR
ncbi:MAG: PEP-CTERM sorting domain-containing protein [Sphingomonas sp.]|nr:PEP-CTERM sorting domain-containing protein [Sphingomonas sp.]